MNQVNRTNYIFPSIGMGLILSAIIFVVVLIPRWTFRPPQPKDLRNYTAQELRGRSVYTREGCFYCHSMVSRPQDWDHGTKSKASDYYYDEWHLLGSERSGPDLSQIGGKFPDEYHIQHHKQPRSLKPGSIMPNYEYLSDLDMTDLTAYMQSLGSNGRRALDPLTGQLKWGELVDAKGPTGEIEKVAVWKGGANFVADRERIASENYDQHLETPYKYTAEVEELLLGTSHEAQLSKGAVQAVATANFPTEEALREARVENPDLRAWSEVSYKEPDQIPTDLAGLAALQKRRTIANQGRGIYNQKCSSCHGLTGNGRGWASASMTKRAANFWEDKFENYRTDTWYWRIRRGVPGTQMPRWEFDLSPEQTLYLVAFQKYISQNKGLGALKGMDAPVYGLPPSSAKTSIQPSN